jgi:4-amino-4-deoxy-L-arabinose transferase-like glycosyltransferase
MRANISSAPVASAAGPRSWTDLRAITLIVIGVSLLYGTRLTLQPLIGEETRWATGAREMLDTGDWIVPRQQGQVFPERPPMSMWLMAVGGWFRGDVDPIAARLPSAIAIVLTSLLIYGYTRAFAASSTALIASLIYATSGQVLQIGRRGESEAVFALFVSASLLLWHLSYVRRCRPILVWTIGFTFAALAAMVKGPQAPAYFGAISVAYLIVSRDLRYLFRWQTLAGSLVFVTIIAAWQIPFYRATDWSSVHATWAGLAGDRIRLSGMLRHAVSYPLETFACLLPWSPMLLAMFYRDVRDWLREKSQVTHFLLTAIVVAYPTVWMASAARGRYFMPLYPVVAVLLALLIECCSRAPRGSGPARAWRRFVFSWAFLIGACAVVVAGNSLLPGMWSLTLHQPTWFALLFAAFAGGAVFAMWISSPIRIFRPSVPVIALASVAGMVAAGFLLNIDAARWSNPTSAIAELTEHIPAGTRLVSLNEIEHRFAYYYRSPIAQLPWPQTVNDIPTNVDYFLFMRHWNDTAEMHAAGRGRTSYTTAGTLPFEWQELATVCTDRQTDTPTATSVVLGKVIRPLRAAVSDASKRQNAIARRPTTSFK